MQASSLSLVLLIMSQDEPSQKSDAEVFFDTMDDALLGLTGSGAGDLADDACLFPIQSELTQGGRRYEELELIGEGAQKRVYRVLDGVSGQEVAYAKLQQVQNREDSESFLREARLTAGLQHPYIVPIYDIGVDDAQLPYFTMPLHHGCNLEEAIQTGELAQVDLLEVFLKICEAIGYAHSKRVIHLDLKPANIQLGAFGELHVCDWGIARVLTDGFDDEQGLDPNILNDTNAHRWLKGSVGFMAPEQVMNDRELGQATDAYALGAILYTVCVGSAPISEDMREGTSFVPSSEFIHAALDDGQVPKGLQAIILKCLSEEQADRYAAAEALRMDVYQHLRGYATSAENAGFWTQCALLVKRNAAMFSYLAASVTVLIAIVISAFFQIQNERQVAVQSKEQALESLRMLQVEQENSQSLQRDLSRMLEDINHSADLASANDQHQVLREAIARESNPKKRRKLERRLIFLSFVIQDFSTAMELLEQTENLRLLKNGCAWAIDLGKEGEALNNRELAELIFMIGRPEYYELLKSMFVSHLQQGRVHEADGYLGLANVMLNFTNNIWGKERNDGTMTLVDGVLKIPPLPYQRFRIGKINLLEPLEFSTLDLSHTGFFEFVQLNGLVIDHLNFSGCRLNEIDSARVQMLKRLEIKEITFNSEYLSDAEVEILGQHFECHDVTELRSRKKE